MERINMVIERVEYKLIRISKGKNGKLDSLNDILDEPENVGIFRDEMQVQKNSSKEIILSVRLDSIPTVIDILRNETEMYDLYYDIMTPTEVDQFYMSRSTVLS